MSRAELVNILPESCSHNLDAVNVVCLRLEPHIVGWEVASEKNIVQVRLAGHDVFQGGVQGPGGEVTGVLPPVLSTRVALSSTAGKTWLTADGVVTLDWGPHTVVQLQVEVRQMEHPADRTRAGGQDWRLIGRDVVKISNVQPPVGLSRGSTGAGGPDSLAISITFQ